MPGLQNTDQRSLEFLTWIQKTIRRKPLPSLNIILLELIKLLWRSPYISEKIVLVWWNIVISRIFSSTNSNEIQDVGTRKTRLSLIIGSQNSMEKKIFLPIHVTFNFLKNVKFSRITRKNWVFSSSSYITSDWKSTIRGRRGKNFLAVYVTWNKKTFSQFQKIDSQKRLLERRKKCVSEEIAFFPNKKTLFF